MGFKQNQLTMKNWLKITIVILVALLFNISLMYLIKEIKRPSEATGVLITKVDTVRIQDKRIPVLQSIKTPIIKTNLDIEINMSDSIVFFKKYLNLVKLTDSLTRELESVKTFCDEIRLDSVGLKIQITDSVTKNAIFYRDFKAEYLKQTIVQQEKQKSLFIISPGVGLINSNPVATVNFDILRRKKYFGVSLGADLNGGPVILVKYSLTPF